MAQDKDTILFKTLRQPFCIFVGLGWSSCGVLFGNFVVGVLSLSSDVLNSISQLFSCFSDHSSSGLSSEGVLVYVDVVVVRSVLGTAALGDDGHLERVNVEAGQSRADFVYVHLVQGFGTGQNRCGLSVGKGQLLACVHSQVVGVVGHEGGEA